MKTMVVSAVLAVSAFSVNAQTYQINAVQYRTMQSVGNPQQNDTGYEIGKVFKIAASMQGPKRTCQDFAMNAIDKSGYAIRYGSKYLYAPDYFEGSTLKNNETGESVTFAQFVDQCVKAYEPIVAWVSTKDQKQIEELERQRAAGAAARKAEADHLESIRAKQRAEQAEQVKQAAAKAEQRAAQKARQEAAEREAIARRDAGRGFTTGEPLQRPPAYSGPQRQVREMDQVTELFNGVSGVLRGVR